MTCITRLRLDAQIYAPAPPRQPGTRGRARKKGDRLPALSAVLADAQSRWQRMIVPRWYAQAARPMDIASATAVWYHASLPVLPLRWVLIRDPLGRFETQALLCTQSEMAPLDVVQYFVQRWQLEVTFEEARRHVGMETQRQWSHLAIARTTPVLLALFSLVTLLATRLVQGTTLPIRQAAWYRKTLPTFSDALAAVRSHWWRTTGLSTSSCEHDIVKVPRRAFQRLHEAACYAA